MNLPKFLRPAIGRASRVSSSRSQTSQLEVLEVRQMLSIDPLVDTIGAGLDDNAPMVMPLAVAEQSIQDSWQAVSTDSLKVSETTGEKPQSKVWTQAGDWFAVMPDSSGTWIWRLDGASWTSVLQLSGSSNTHADVKSIGYVAHVLLFDGGGTQLASVQYVAATRGYEFWSARPSNVGISLPGNTETATIDIDSRGRMWMAYDNKSNNTVEVRYSDNNYSVWSGPITIASGLKTDDISSLIAMPGGKIGVFWSNQSTSRFGFRTHDDSAAANTWNAAEIPAAQSASNGMADDHMHLAVGADGTLYVAAKTSYDSSSKPEIILLVRHPDGSWDPLYEVSGVGTRPVVVVDNQVGRLLVAYTEQDGGGKILYRESSLDSISFGPAGVLISGSNNNVTTTKQNFTNEILFLAGTSSSVKGTLLVGPAIGGGGTGGAVDPGNLPPLVTAGPDRATQLGSPVSLAGGASDDGQPGGGLTYSWTQVSGPGVAIFGNANQATTNATFSAAGSYVLRLTANDGELASSDEVLVTVTTSTPVQPPADIVGFWSFAPNLGAQYPSVLGSTGTLLAGASVSGDGRLALGGNGQYYVVPQAAELNFTQAITLTAWIQPAAYGNQSIVSKAGSGSNGYELGLSDTGRVFVRFNQTTAGDSFRLDSTSIYPSNGAAWMHVAATYDGATIRLYVNGQLQASKAASFSLNTNNLPLTIGAGQSGSNSLGGKVDEVMLASRALSAAEIGQVYAGGFRATPPTNQPPSVSAGADRTAEVGKPIALTGIVSDDGLPSGAVTSVWSRVSGPGSVTFGNASALNTTATFSVEGTYVLQLASSDGQLSASDQLTVVVGPASVAPPNMVGFWNFYPGKGASYSSQLGDTGSLQGGATVNAQGRLSQNGSNQHYVVADAPALHISQAITLTAWIQPSSGGEQTLVKKAGSGTVDGFELGLSATGKVFVRFNQQSAGDSLRVDSTASYPTNGLSWMHVAATYDGTTIRLYINGQLQGSKAASFTIGTNTLPLSIGSGDGGSQSMRGALDEVLIADRALTAAEVGRVYVGNFNPNQLPDTNQPPVVSAGPDRSAQSGSAIALQGTATDDGLPSGVLLSQWSVMSGPGSVTFANANSATTSASFAAVGNYVLRLTVSDGSLSSSDDLLVTVTANNSSLVGFWNFLPGIGAGYPSQLGTTGSLQGGATVNAQGRLVLAGSGQRYEVPNAAQLQISHAITLTSWIRPEVGGGQTILSKGDGTANGYELGMSDTGKIFVRFNAASSGDSFRVDSTSSFPTNGAWMHVAATYDGATIRLYLNGQLQGSKAASFTIGTNSLPLTIGSGTGGTLSMRGTLDEVLVTDRALSAAEIAKVHAGGFDPTAAPPMNQPPTVAAGPDRSTAANTALTLNGAVSDDGRPSGSLTSQWSLVSGPGSVAFGNAASPVTTATFSAAGSYLLRLTALDGSLTASDDVTVTVTAADSGSVVGRWKFDNGSTSDSSGQGNNAVLQGATLGSGYAGGGLLISGGSQRAEVADSPSLDISKTITIAAWIQPTAKGTQYVVTKADKAATDGFELSLSSDGTVFVRFNEKSSGDTYRLSSSTKYPTDGSTWLHVAATYDGTTIRLYINGQEQASKQALFSIATNDLPLAIGSGSGGYRPMKGAIDDVLLANRALTSSEIQSLYNGTFT